MIKYVLVVCFLGSILFGDDIQRLDNIVTDISNLREKSKNCENSSKSLVVLNSKKSDSKIIQELRNKNRKKDAEIKSLKQKLKIARKQKVKVKVLKKKVYIKGDDKNPFPKLMPKDK